MSAKEVKMKSKRNEERDAVAMKKSAERSAERGAPDFGAKEADILNMKQQIRALTASNNVLVRKLREFDEQKVVERVTESHYMVQTIMTLLVSKGFCTDEEVRQLAYSIQQADIGLENKENEVVELGDVMLMKFEIYDGETVVDSQMESVLAYLVGCGGLPCEEGMIGMRAGEARMFDVTFGENFRKKELIGRPLRMNVLCVGVKRKKQESKEEPAK